MSETFTKIGGYIASGDPLVYGDANTISGSGTVADPFGVKTQQLFVQAPLFTGTSGEGSATSGYIGFSGYNETVLWSGGNLAIGSTATLSETVKNFERFGVYGHETNRGRGVYQEFNPAVVVNANTQNFALFLPDCAPDMSWAGWYIENLYFTDTAATALANVSGRQTWRWYANANWEDGGDERYIQVDKIIGINRKQ